MSDKHDILSEFNCPECSQYMHPPIYWCTEGHTICKNCKSDNNVCPYCEYESSYLYRCIAMENIYAKLEFPCKFHTEGCTITTSDFDNIEEHEYRCIQNSARLCPLAINQCNWYGKYEEMSAHVQDEHSRLVTQDETFVITLDSPKSNITLDSPKSKTKVVFIKKYDNMFQLIVHGNENCLKITVQYVGCPAEAHKYIYKTVIFKNKNKAWIMTESCEELQNLDLAFANEKGVSISKEKLKKFFDLNSKIKISILKAHKLSLPTRKKT